MFRRIFLGMAAAAITLAPGAALAQTEDGPAFTLTFYEDAAHTQWAGFAAARCYPGPHAQLIHGHSTQYEEVTWVGQCIGGEFYPD